MLSEILSFFDADANFATTNFVLGFLPIAVVSYWLVPPGRTRLAWLTVLSLLFYSLWDWRFAPLLVAGALVDFTVALRIQASQSKRRWLIASIVANLGVLAVFKYAMFAAANAQSLLQLLGVPVQLPYFHIILPVGISFYTFQTMSYTLDVYRGHVAPTRDPVRFVAYVSLFPQLVAGPIVRYADLSPQLDQRHQRPSAGALWFGLTLFAVGLAKKVLIADRAGVLGAPFWEDVAGIGFFDAWTAALSYTVQLYFDFSGYSDMAIAIGALLGFRFPQNFRNPYHALDPSDFWRRWHITLGNFLRDYLYVPLGGNKVSARRRGINLLIVMALGGLWHGAAWTFVIWGVYHGVLLATHAALRRPWSRLPVIVQRGSTFVLVVIGWVLFKAASIGEAGAVLAGMIGLHGFGSPPGLAPDLLVTLAACAAALGLRLDHVRSPPPSLLRAAVLGALLAGTISILASNPTSEFLYYQF